MEDFLIYVDDMRFLSVDELFIKKEMIKQKLGRLSVDYRELYKWYYYYQLSVFKEFKDCPIKTTIWDYLHNNCSVNDVNECYRKWCNKRDRLPYM